MKQSPYRTPLAKVRGLGSAREGTQHFIRQRLTALVLIPLTAWFVASLLRMVSSSAPDVVTAWFSSGLNAAALIFMLVALFWHAAIGMQVIIEDYMHCTFTKMLALILNSILAFALGALSVLAVLKLHFHSFPGAAG